MISALFQQLSTVQDKKQLDSVTIVAAATIAPSTFLTKISGTTQIQTITPPLGAAQGVLLLAFIAAATNSFALTTGNILGGVTTSSTILPTLMIYDNIQAKWLVLP